MGGQPFYCREYVPNLSTLVTFGKGERFSLTTVMPNKHFMSGMP